MLLVTGAGGQLGQALVRLGTGLGLPCKALTHAELDVSNAADVENVLFPLTRGGAVDCIINCAAFAQVDDCEDAPERAYAVNAFGPWLVARTGVPVIHISTDYVFDGASRTAYETDAAARPLSVYGLSKRAGETALLEGGFQGLVVRTAWLYSKRPQTRNFYQSIRRLGLEHPVLRVVDDQFGTPTRVEDLAEALLALYAQKAHEQSMRLVHFTNAGSCSRLDFARAVVEHCNLNCRIEPVKSSCYPTKARRPASSVLSLASLEAFGIAPRPWLEALMSI